MQYVEHITNVAPSNNIVNRAIGEIKKFLEKIKDGQHLSVNNFINTAVLNEAVLIFIPDLLDKLVKFGEVVRAEINGEMCFRKKFASEMPKKRKVPTFNPSQAELF